jgi:hypothetical protein
MNAITGATMAQSEGAYPVPTLDDASYNPTLIKDACADAEMIVVQVIANIPNHPWRSFLRKSVLNGITGMGVQSGENLYTKPGPPGTIVTDCVALGPPVTHDGLMPLREKPVHEIIRRNRNAGSFYQQPVYYYRIVDNIIYHTAPPPNGVDINYFQYDKQTDTLDKMAAGSPLFPTCIPAYVAGACSLLLKEEEYAGQCQYYAQLFQSMLSQIAQGFSPADPMQQPAPLKGTEAA